MKSELMELKMKVMQNIALVVHMKTLIFVMELEQSFPFYPHEISVLSELAHLGRLGVRKTRETDLHVVCRVSVFVCVSVSACV